MAKTTKAKRERAQAIIKGTSGEPNVTKDSYKIDLIKALNWYNYHAEEKEIRSYADQYIKKMDMKEYSYAVSRSSYLEIKPVGALGRLILRGEHVELNDVETLLTHLEQLSASYTKPKTPAVKVEDSVVVPILSIQERITETARGHAAEIDEQIDLYTQNKASTFSTSKYLSANEVSGVVAKRIGDMYKNLAAELVEAYKGDDEQLSEGYSNFTKPQLKKFAAFIEQIISDCDQQVVSSKAQRKPRARKAKPASVIVNKMKYMKEFADLNLKSVNPATIIGASELWVYIPDKRKLTVFYAVANGELGVNRMSITNYDIMKSETKTIRKPEEFFKGLSLGKRALANTWKAINAKPTKPRSRISEDMILLMAN